VLAGIGLVDAALLAAPRWGTINGHPGLLPWVRGNGVVAHSIARGVAVGASVHHVDDGIDRGPVLARRLLPVAPDVRELQALEREALTLTARLLADVAAMAVRDGRLPPGTPQSEMTPLCRWMNLTERAQVEAAVREGVAARLHASWRGREEVEVFPGEDPDVPFVPR
jgi:methionyl-tRNA formyltransferase